MSSENEKKRKIAKLIEFLELAPTAWHAVAYIETHLLDAGFIKLEETAAWQIKPGHRYFVIRDGSICAFTTPYKNPTAVRLLASHLDSPSLKLKPSPEFRKQNMILFGVEIYGAPLLSSWLNRDLGVAGRVLYEDRYGDWQEKLVNITNAPLVIPQLAIHLDREVNEKGLQLNKQEHLNALAAIDPIPDGSYFDTLLRNQIDFKRLVSHDLFLYPLEKPHFIGYQEQMIASYRIDSLASVHACVEALIENSESDQEHINMIALWNSEEIGSHTHHGAGSPFVMQVLERVLIQWDNKREALFRVLANSFCVSVDLAHAIHPNHSEKHDTQHPILLGKGIVLKSNAQQRYATDMKSARLAQEAATKAHISLQNFVSRNDIPCGTTIGPIHATHTGMITVDLGCSQLSMHSAREILSCSDQYNMYTLLSAFYQIR